MFRTLLYYLQRSSKRAATCQYQSHQTLLLAIMNAQNKPKRLPREALYACIMTTPSPTAPALVWAEGNSSCRSIETTPSRVPRSLRSVGLDWLFASTKYPAYSTPSSIVARQSMLKRSKRLVVTEKPHLCLFTSQPRSTECNQQPSRGGKNLRNHTHLLYC